jgi:glucose-1-phosphate adenylyltransferase
MRNVIAMVLGGGQGTRLYPLTKVRSKPAVPVAGKYRLIDIPISNCINSGLNRIYVLTQFNSSSLHRHIRSTYIFDAFDRGFVEISAAQQTIEHSNWYQGTADAVRQNLNNINEPGIEYVLILSGDQLYRMDFREMLETHCKSGADVTISAVPVSRDDAKSMGIMRVDETGRVVGFLEKPQTDREMDIVRTDPAWIDSQGVHSGGRDCLASMGIYLFNRKTLLDALEKTPYRDFGKEVFPASMRTHRVQLHLFDGYWEDIGTIKSFYEANLQLAGTNPRFNLSTPAAPIYTSPRFLPPTRLDGATIRGSLIADGCRIEEGAVIENSVVGLRCVIGRDVTIRNSVLMGNDYYELPGGAAAGGQEPPVGVGAGTVVESAIIDKNCLIGPGAQIINHCKIENSPETSWGMIRDGIIVIPKGSVIPPGWKLDS